MGKGTSKVDIVSASTGAERAKLAFILSVPAIAENLLITLVGIIDTAMVGALGAKATTAVALVQSPVWVVNALAAAFNVGCSVLVARYIGAREYDDARRGARETFVLGLGFGIFAFLLMWFLAPFIPVWMGGEPEVCPASTSYLRIVSSGYPLYFMGLILCGAIRGSGDTYTPMKITASANLLNIIGNFFLIYEPRTVSLLGNEINIWGAGFGVDGAAMATAASTAVSGAAALIILMFKGSELKISFRESFKLDKKDLRQIVKVGFPTAVERVTVNLGQVVFIRIVSTLGTVMLAAHHIAVSAESVCYQPGYGMQSAGTMLTGQALGAKNEELAESYSRIVMIMSVAIMAFNAFLMFVFAEPFISLFTPDPEVKANAIVALRIVAFAQPFFGMYIVGTGLLRGLGDVKIAMPVSLICMWFMRIPLAFAAVVILNLGLSGAWIAMIIDLIVRGLFILYRLHSGKWKEMYHRVFA